MPRSLNLCHVLIVGCLAVGSHRCFSQELRPASAKVQEQNVTAHLNVLAGDSLQGRGSGTKHEYRTAIYLASQLQTYGLLPMGDQTAEGTRSFLQSFELRASKGRSWNVIGQLSGIDPAAAEDIIILSAHMDHLGVDRTIQGDGIYNGADDNASGVSAVLELARIMSLGSPPKRTVYFVFFGSEEKGCLGSRYFVDQFHRDQFHHQRKTPRPTIVANINLEMIGRPSQYSPKGTPWMTGFEQSNLGETFIQQGSDIRPDPYPELGFFTKSDNASFVKRGIVAHTLSSFSLHQDYHQPSDEIALIDLEHLTGVIDTLINPIQWLANSSFQPEWTEQKQAQTSRSCS